MKKTQGFEESIEQLDSLVRALESGALTLDESLKAYEQAVRLVKTCNAALDAAKQKVSILLENPDGTVSEKPFTEENADEA